MIPRPLAQPQFVQYRASSSAPSNGTRSETAGAGSLESLLRGLGSPRSEGLLVARAVDVRRVGGNGGAPGPGIRVRGSAAVGTNVPYQRRDERPACRHPSLAASVHGRAIVSATASVERGAYPEPSTDFAIDPDVQTLWLRWRGHVEGREPLQSMACFALTVLMMRGGRSGASSRFGISAQVLTTLARLSSERRDELTARKQIASLQLLTPSESAWLRAAVLALVRRAGEVAADPIAARPQLTMADLPAIKQGRASSCR